MEEGHGQEGATGRGRGASKELGMSCFRLGAAYMLVSFCGNVMELCLLPSVHFAGCEGMGNE